MSFLSTGMTWLNKIRSTKLSESVSYQNKALGETIVIKGLRTGSTYESVEEGGVIAEARSTDFIVAAADLVFGSGTLLPVEGDTISVTVGSVTSIFEVLALPGGTHYKPLDGTGIMFRIHTRQIDET